MLGISRCGVPHVFVLAGLGWFEMKCATKNFCKSTNRGTEHCAPWLPNRQHKTQQKDVGAFWNSQRSTTPTRTAPHPLLCVTPLCTPAAQHCWQAVQHRGLSTSWTPSRGTALSTVHEGQPGARTHQGALLHFHL